MFINFFYEDRQKNSSAVAIAILAYAVRYAWLAGPISDWLGSESLVFVCVSRRPRCGRYESQRPRRCDELGTTNLISRIIRETLGDEDYYTFPYRELLGKAGITSMVLEPDAGGTFVGSSFSYASARDWARFGLLYLNDGVAGGEQILPEGWISYTTTPAPAS